MVHDDDDSDAAAAARRCRRDDDTRRYDAGAHAIVARREINEYRRAMLGLRRNSRSRS